jgi:hypothetical protein
LHQRGARSPQRGAMRFPGVRTIVVAGVPLGVALGGLEVAALARRGTLGPAGP